MRVRTVGLVVVAAALVAADPASPEPAPSAPPPAEPAPQPEVRSFVGPGEPPEAPEAPASGEEALARLVELLGRGEYEAVLGDALLGVTRYPELAASFQAAAEVAADQLERRRTAPVANPYGRPYGPAYRQRPRIERPVRAGFDLGLPTGVRAEIVTGGRTVDSVGLRFGGTLWWYGMSSLVPGWEGALYLDWSVTDTWQLETPVGVLSYDGTPYPMIGLGVQYDPPTPLQVNVGVQVTTYGLAPDIQVGFLW